MATDVDEGRTEAMPPGLPVPMKDGEREDDRPTRGSQEERVSVTWRPSKRQLTILGLVAALAIAVGVAWLFNVGTGSLLVFAMVLACPLMHLFMMRGMGHGGQQGCHGPQQSKAQAPAERSDDRA